MTISRSERYAAMYEASRRIHFETIRAGLVRRGKHRRAADSLHVDSLAIREAEREVNEAINRDNEEL